MPPYTAPKLNEAAFNCPLCNAYSTQEWHSSHCILNRYGGMLSDARLDKVQFCTCEYCKGYSIWVGEKIIYPLTNGAPLPHSELSTEIKDIYNEARGIMSLSPRSACALLRVALENLVDEIMARNKKTLNENIGSLVKQGKLPDTIQKAMDVLRITADAMLHPNTIDLENKDNRETAIGMFNLLNIIAQVLIADRKKIDEYYDGLPKPQKDSIERRDKKKT